MPDSVTAAKEQAKSLRAALEKAGVVLRHSEALELIARQLGYRDWNTIRALGGGRPQTIKAAIRRQSQTQRLTCSRPRTGWKVGDRAFGRYLSQPFEATILAVGEVRSGWFEVTLDFDKAVDIVTFDAFSSFRKRVTGVVGQRGFSRERTSNGHPQLEVNPLQSNFLR